MVKIHSHVQRKRLHLRYFARCGIPCALESAQKFSSTSLIREITEALIGVIKTLKNIRKARNTFSTKTLNGDHMMKTLINEGKPMKTRIVYSIGRNLKHILRTKSCLVIRPDRYSVHACCMAICFVVVVLACSPAALRPCIFTYVISCRSTSATEKAYRCGWGCPM